MAMYMNFDGAKGNATAKGYENWVELNDVEFAGVRASVGMEVGQKMDRFHSKPAFGEVVIGKGLDGASQKLFEAAHSGAVIPSLEIDYVMTGDPNFTYSKLKLTNVAVTHFGDRNSGNGKPQEVVRLAYTQMSRTYVPRNSAGSAGSQSVSGFDVENATKL